MFQIKRPCVEKFQNDSSLECLWSFQKRKMNRKKKMVRIQIIVSIPMNKAMKKLLLILTEGRKSGLLWVQDSIQQRRKKTMYILQFHHESAPWPQLTPKQPHNRCECSQGWAHHRGGDQLLLHPLRPPLPDPHWQHCPEYVGWVLLLRATKLCLLLNDHLLHPTLH